ncbi:hypothetical protein HYH02_009584 [Chlamydomonas schloesseri]|uniref:Uncharacterized protein n=1 Tax=Chlamydomonas schloesseri TaxID=2026947 RepID=A0A835TNA6_9CHLO|nr:hypothetical protein HYH02_009584 [Chlamydomonas schloesseri]|eukprot:KAG2442095.1 hypothetical protein HYH02_009584 [Chlamydomonas schloesseri]
MSKTKESFKSDESWERWNTHQTTQVEQEVFGTVLRFVQDPSSEHLGTTVWDASVVLAKWFEKNIRKGDFARAKVRGKRALELGAGMGLAGMAFAMVGANVVLTDTVDVLPLLRINYETNLSPAAVRLARGHQHGTWADGAGTVEVQELDWTKPEQVAPLHPPFDYVLAADCIYHEGLTEDFHRTVMQVTNEKSTVVVCNELRSHSVQGRFMSLFTATHSIKSVPHAKMDDKYQHQNIFIYIMKKKKKGKAGVEEHGDDEHEEAAGDVGAGPGAAAPPVVGAAAAAEPASAAVSAAEGTPAASEAAASEAGCSGASEGAGPRSGAAGAAAGQAGELGAGEAAAGADRKDGTQAGAGAEAEAEAEAKGAKGQATDAEAAGRK